MEEKSMEEFNPYGDLIDEGTLNLATYEAVSKFKSVRRAIRKGKVSINGMICPKRPFNNAANTCKRGKHSRVLNEQKKIIYEQIKEYGYCRSKGS